jgi:hypothetical protein
MLTSRQAPTAWECRPSWGRRHETLLEGLDELEAEPREKTWPELWVLSDSEALE